VLDQPLDLRDSADRFVAEFNRHRDRPRLVALVSPKCAECLAGARSAQTALTQSRGRAALFLVWMKGLPEDERNIAETRAHEFGDDDIHQFWDGQNLLGTLVATRLGRDGLIAWDIYLGFASGLAWDEEMPKPTGWLHQMGDAAWASDRERALAHELESRIRHLLNECAN